MKSLHGSSIVYYEPDLSIRNTKAPNGIVEDTFLGLWFAAKTTIKSVTITLILACYAVMFLLILNTMGVPLPAELHQIVTFVQFDLWVGLKEFEFQSGTWRTI